jgi:hypothetical protein
VIRNFQIPVFSRLFYLACPGKTRNKISSLSMKKFVIIFSHNNILYDATVTDLSFPYGKIFSVGFTSPKNNGFIPKLNCIDTVKLKWDSEEFSDKELCQVIGHAIAMNYKKEYLAQLLKSS